MDIKQIGITPIQTIIRNGETAGLIPNLKLGRFINSGISSDVFEIEGQKGLVARIKRGVNFVTDKLKSVKDPIKITLYSTPEGDITIMKKIKGEPLFGTCWRMEKLPTFEEYSRQLDEYEKLPDETFINYMKKVIRLRKQKYAIDTYNPNNYLLDKKGKRINIIDLCKWFRHKDDPLLSMDDISPLLDGLHLEKFMKSLDKDDKQVLIKRIKDFMDRMVRIAVENNYELNFTGGYEPYKYIYLNNTDVMNKIFN